MSIFGFSSRKEVARKEQEAREQGLFKGKLQGRAEGVKAGKEAVILEQKTSLSNLAKGSQVKFVIPYFDVFDPRFLDFGVPISVHGMIVYGVDDIDRFYSINKSESIDDEVFQQKMKGQVTKFVKSVIANVPSDNQIPVLQIERKILEISTIVQNYVAPQVERLFGVNVRSIDITSINVDKEAPGYRELKSVTADLEKEALLAKSSLSIDALKRQQELNLGGQEEMQRMQLEHQRESMRIQREELQRASRLQTETNFLSAHQANLNAGVQSAQAQAGMAPPMPGMGEIPPMPGSMPKVQYMVGVNGQQVGPCDWQQLQELVEQGLLTHQTYVWKQGMAQWQLAGEIQELTPLFQSGVAQMPPMPNM